MKKFLKFRRLLFSCFLILLIAGSASLAGCKGSGGYPPINLDSARPHVIPIQRAIAYTADYQATLESFGRKCPGLKDSLQFGKAESFNRDALNLLLIQKDSAGRLAAGVRIYYGLDKKGLVKLVLVPYDVNGNDIIKELIVGEKPQPGPSAAAVTDPVTGQTVEEGQRCPTACDNGKSGLGGR